MGDEDDDDGMITIRVVIAGTVVDRGGSGSGGTDDCSNVLMLDTNNHDLNSFYVGTLCSFLLLRCFIKICEKELHIVTIMIFVASI